MSAARKCDRPECPNAMDPRRHPYLRVVLMTPVAPEDDTIASRDACSAECAHWLVDEHNEHLPR